MQRLFVSEALCGGAFCETELPPSLFAEGRAMWLALLEDLQDLPEVKIVTTHDARLEPVRLERVTSIPVARTSEEEALFRQLATECDGTILVAPELDHLLEQRVSWLHQLGAGRLVSTPEAVSLTADKWEFYQFCSQHKIPTPQTQLLCSSRFSEISFPLPWIVKPRHGAGTVATYVVSSQQKWETLWETQALNEQQTSIVQPMLEGIPISRSVLKEPLTGGLIFCPIGLQRFENLQYLGGIIPDCEKYDGKTQTLINTVLQHAPEFRGYLGFDFFLLAGPDPELVIMEVNPRLTTSYLGYRHLAESSLAFWMVGHSEKPTLRWKNSRLIFDQTGQYQWISSQQYQGKCSLTES